jgi:hypothetical protein
MILTKEGKGELMIDTNTGRGFVRRLSIAELDRIEFERDLEIFNDIQDRYSEPEVQLEALEELGFHSEYIAELALATIDNYAKN